MKSLEALNALTASNLMGHFSIVFVEISEAALVALMPVDERHVQPFGRLHGGASLALAESVASAGSWALLDNDRAAVVGSEVNASHVGTARAGSVVTASARLLHRGRLHHVWEVKITDEGGKPVSYCRVTNTIVIPS
ncbi:MAG: hypothetical protein BGP01_05895 [Paludibacter sp. 47-17]|nr:MAG: hypothetical protein ABS72_03135 [Paludibacter sp. SCN 50-10]ODU61819.1 MAG: hypothetical protein ABT12_00385 [Paludibacter sp. SCN 51-9]OJX88864.1 MAG: hypothetical protein BGP01_05895 [Paludibacter sp. 47-17]